MPCRCDPPSHEELLRERLYGFLTEIGVAHRRDLSLDRMTRELCAWCKANDVREKSLELQIWWRDHQRADRERQERAQKEAERLKLARAAAKKLTAQEMEALGVTGVE
jgi:hypothetical protein